MSEETKVITIEEVEDKTYDGKDYKHIFDGHDYYNVKQGREGSLKAKWNLLQKGNRIKLIFGEFNQKRFVHDIELVGQEAVPPLGQPNRLASTNSSIEQQVAVKTVAELWLVDKLTTNDYEVRGMREWIRERLPIEPSESSKQEALTTPSLVDIAIFEEGAIPEFKNKGDFLTQVYKYCHYTRDETLRLLKTDLEKLTDLEGAWTFLVENKRNEERDKAKENQAQSD